MTRRRRRRFRRSLDILKWTEKHSGRRYGDPNAPRIGATGAEPGGDSGAAVSVVALDGNECRKRFKGGGCLCPPGECWLSEQEAALRRGLDPEPYHVWLEAKAALHREADSSEWRRSKWYRHYLTKTGKSRRKDRKKPIHPLSAKQYAAAIAYHVLRHRDPGWFYAVDFTPEDLANIRDEWFSLLLELRERAGDEADVLRNKREGHGRTVLRQDVLGVLRRIPVKGGIVPGVSVPGKLPVKQYGFKKLDPTYEEIREEARQRGREDEAEYKRARQRAKAREARSKEPPLID